MKGVILAGGKGTRLQPATLAMNKHMVPIVNRPMILYPLETLKKLGIKDILIVSGGNHIGAFAEFLGDGAEYGVSLTYRVQREAGGIAQALGLAEDFVGDDKVAVILGDNIFEFDGKYVRDILSGDHEDQAHIFVKRVEDAYRFGVLIENDGKYNIVEKPAGMRDGMAITGLYVYPSDVFSVVRDLKPSDRGELEISDVNAYYMNDKRLIATELSGFWSDAGTPDSLVRTINWVINNRDE